MNPKSILNRLCQQRGLPIPIYDIKDPQGPSHDPRFRYGRIQVGKYVVNIDDGNYKNLKDMEKRLAIEIYFIITTIEADVKVDIDLDVIYIIDYDHNGHLKSRLDQYNCVIFVGVGFNNYSLPKNTDTLEVIKANDPGKDMVDHMMTWWACEHRDRLRKYKKVFVVSKDTSLSSLVHIMNDNQIKAKYLANM